MDQYLIGAGAVLTAGRQASIAPATLHAQTDPHLAAQVKAALIDFESADPRDLSRIVIVLSGWSGARFRETVTRPLLARGECSLADVMAALASAAGTHEVHVFARWAPQTALQDDPALAGVRLVSHPLESIEQAALISGQAFSRWQSPFRAA